MEENAYRSGLERRVGAQLDAAKAPYEYEIDRLPYTLVCNYTPDFKLSNGIYVECKGRFTSEDRRKMRAVKAANPTADIRMVFSRSASKLSKGAKQTYGEWCDRHGFPYADKLVPISWLTEPPSESTK